MIRVLTKENQTDLVISELITRLANRSSEELTKLLSDIPNYQIDKETGYFFKETILGVLKIKEKEQLN